MASVASGGCTHCIASLATGGAFGRTLKLLILSLNNRVIFSLQNLILQNSDFLALDNRTIFFQLSPDRKMRILEI